MIVLYFNEMYCVNKTVYVLYPYKEIKLVTKSGWK